jgi:two-component system, chemotaxis family, CheB/CheR fusion protein
MKKSAGKPRVTLGKPGEKMGNGAEEATESLDLEKRRRFPIIAIGASAGGLEALEAFFKNVPADTGMAFVVVQHLDPKHDDMLAELLQRRTRMKVGQIEDGTRVEPGQVYVIPPGRDLSIFHGILYLLEHSEERGLRQPIDFFFRSLAEDWHESGAAVVLSGMGTDGTIGARALKEQCGVVFVQDPETAKFDSMPRSVIATGGADVVAAPEELPAKIAEYFQNTVKSRDVRVDDEENDASGMEKVLILMRRQTGHDFSVYKRSTLWRRIERRMNLHHLSAVGDYIRYIRENPHELDLLFKEMLIGVTGFFRDETVWDQLRGEVFPELIRSRPDGGTLRAWTAGCSTGEEAYSLAIVFQEALEMVAPAQRVSLQIFATDLDNDGINRARLGVYPENVTKSISDERLRRFFRRTDGGYQVAKEIREKVVFATQNVISDAPFTRLDILSCRNLLIYLRAELQKKLLPLFHYCLNPGGFLMLGNAETIGPATDLFAPMPGKERIYRRLETSAPLERMHFPVAFNLPSGRSTGAEHVRPASPPADIQSQASEFLLSHHTPCAVLVSEAGDILYINGKTNEFLEPAAGRANWNLFVMARGALSHPLYEVFRRAVREKKAITAHDVQVSTEDDGTFVNVTVHPISEPASMQGMVMVVFEKTEPPGRGLKARPAKSGKRDGRLTELSRELRHSQEELQVLREEMQTTGEELKSSNEELQSANEELQSMNEELTTSKEEMQAMNEELQVVNQDLMIKLQDLSRTNNDMKNLLSSTDTATLFLDNDLNVRWFAPQTADIIHLIASDVGRPVTDIVTRLDYATLAEDTREVLRTLTPMKKEVPARDGRWFAARIIPYRTKESMIDGLVITFLEITETKRIEEELDDCRKRLRKKGGDA